MPRSTPPPEYSSSPSRSVSSSSSSKSSSSSATFLFPPNDSTTHRDVLLFEERLKSTAASLQKRKKRYQLFLFQLLTFITFLLYEAIVSPEASLLAISYTWLLQRLSFLPGLYPDDSSYYDYTEPVLVHPTYLTTGLLFVSVTTLVLFFASGMYSEKIAYANKYVPQANRALRSFNIYLNVRQPPLRSKFQFGYWNPMSFFFPRPQEENNNNNNEDRLSTPLRHSRSRSSTPSRGTPRSSRSPSPTPYNNNNNTPNRRSSSSSSSGSNMIPISPIPPSSNPRGELIFSSRIDRGFRESYERYRAAFERKREEKERKHRQARWKSRMWRWVLFWRKWEPEEMTTPVHTRTASLLRGSSAARPRTASRTPPPTPTSSPLGSSSGRQLRRERSVSPSRRFFVEDNANMRTMALERSSMGLSPSWNK